MAADYPDPSDLDPDYLVVWRGVRSDKRCLDARRRAHTGPSASACHCGATADCCLHCYGDGFVRLGDLPRRTPAHP